MFAAPSRIGMDWSFFDFLPADVFHSAGKKIVNSQNKCNKKKQQKNRVVSSKKKLTNYINYDRIYNWKLVSDALVAELADALDLGSSIYDVGVQVSSGAPKIDKYVWYLSIFV